MFIFEKDIVYQMPPWFGGTPLDETKAKQAKDVITISYTQTTDGDRLADYLPEGFELLKPELHVAFNQCREVEFMAGGYYNLIQVSVPARFHGKREQIDGSFILVVWENKTRPILSGREQSGYPKIYADIEDLHIYQNKYYTNASFEGNTFLRFVMVQPQPVDEESLEQIRAATAQINGFGWRYIPKVPAPGAELSQPVLYPQSMDVHNAWTGKGAVEWTKLTREQNENQYHIINSLADLPIKNTTVLMFKSFMTWDPFSGRVLR